MALDDYVPFDLDGDISNTQGYISEIFDALGVDSWRDVFHDIQEEADPEHTRGTRYSTAEEALIDMYERGLMNFTGIVYYEEDDQYGIYIEYDE